MMSTVDHSETRRTERVNFRATRYQAELLRSGAEVRGINVSQYVLETACQQAEQDLLDRSHFRVTEEKMKAFLAALDRPVEPKPRMERLLSEPSVLEKK